MAAGCPCLVSNAASLPEVCGDGALYCDPRDPADMAKQLGRLLTDDVLRARLVRAGRARAASFDWDVTAERTAAVLDRALGLGDQRRMTPRVTAIVLNWCKEADTAACLESLAASTYEALDVLLVDNGSPDGSGDRLHARFPDVDYLQTGVEPRLRGRKQSRNAARARRGTRTTARSQQRHGRRSRSA